MFRRMCQICVLHLLGTLSVAVAGDVPSIVDANTRSLNKIQSYSASIIQEIAITEGVDSPLVTNRVYDVWHSGSKHRMRQRVFYAATPEDELAHVKKKKGDVTDTSWGEKEVKVLEGLDWERPPSLPIEFGKDVQQFSEIHGAIALRDPKVSFSNHERMSLLWDLHRDSQLDTIAREATLELDAPPREGVERLRVVSTNNPQLRSFVGLKIDLDTSKGSMVSRLEMPGVGSREVVRFGQGAMGDWIPLEVRGYEKDRLISRVTVTEFTLNEPIDDSLLDVVFPPGVRVRDYQGNYILWGDGKPEVKRTDFAEFMGEVYARAREYQSGSTAGGDGPLSKSSTTGIAMLFNVTMIMILIALTIVRRRYGTAKK